MNYAILWNAIKDYPQLTPGVIAAAMNKADQNVPRESITGDELLEQTDLGELVAFDDKRTAAYWGSHGNCCTWRAILCYRPQVSADTLTCFRARM